MAESNVLPNTTVLTIAAAGSSSEKLIVCLTDTGYTITNASVDATSFCGANTIPGSQTVDVTFSGQRVISPDAGHISEAGLFALTQGKTRVEFTLGTISPDTGDFILAGEGYLNNFSTTNPTNGVPTMTGTINTVASTVAGTETV